MPLAPTLVATLHLTSCFGFNAARLGHEHVIKLIFNAIRQLPLAEATAILDSKSADGHTGETLTPLEVACKNGHKDCEALLRRFRAEFHDESNASTSMKCAP